MKNGKLVTAYFDECAACNALPRNTDEWLARLTEGLGDRLWQACLDDGWSVAELDAAYERRFARKVNRGALRRI